jgi:hypothetical protein
MYGISEEKSGMEEKKKQGCENCGLRKQAEAHPNTWKARLWRWHTKWCPGWKAYQRSLSQQK